MKKNLFLAGSAFALLVCLACEGAEGIVNAAWLNARVFPELKSPVAVKLPRNKKVEVTKRHGLWLEIVAPDTTPVFASAAFLDETKVLRDINLRIRPAAGAAVIGRVRKGDTLKAVSSPDRFGWVQVAPLPEMRLYVYKDYVTYDPAQVPVARMTPAGEEKKNEQPAEAKAAPVKPAPAPAPAPTPAPAKAAPAPAPEK
ncbi:MAG: SH3 domain-containing protein, partial [Lentisphaeria bacterium]|nr:SH3 domain-containing protein [Lentisphaeria bacterium]